MLHTPLLSTLFPYTTLFRSALRLSYHPALHSAGGSPLVADPEHFLRPLRRSRTGAVLLSTEIPPSSRPPRPVARNRPEGSPVRLAVIAQENWTFIRPVLDRSEEHTSELQSRGQLVCRLLHENTK